MLRMLGHPRRFCDGITRRQALTAGALSVLGSSFTLPELLAREGASVISTGRDEQRGKSAAAGIDGRVRFVQADLRDVDRLQTIIRETGDADGPIRVLVNNAGNDDRHRLEDLTPDYWDDRMAVNLRHQVFAVQAVRPQMREAGGGSIVNFGSITWKVGDGDLRRGAGDSCPWEQRHKCPVRRFPDPSRWYRHSLRPAARD